MFENFIRSVRKSGKFKRICRVLGKELAYEEIAEKQEGGDRKKRYGIGGIA